MTTVDVESRAAALLDAYLDDTETTSEMWGDGPVALATARAIIDSEPEVQAALIPDLLVRLLHTQEQLDAMPQAGVTPGAPNLHLRAYCLSALLRALLRRRLPYTERDVHVMLSTVRALPATSRWRETLNLPVLIGGVKRALGHEQPSADVRTSLVALRRWWLDSPLDESGRAKVVARIDQILTDADDEHIPVTAEDPLGDALLRHLEQISDGQRAGWTALIRRAAKASSSTPSRVWRKAMARHIEAVGREQFQQQIVAWLGIVTTMQPVIHGYALGFPTGATFLAEPNATVLKGLIWACAELTDDAIARALGDAAESGYKKIPGLAQRSVKTGNACAYALSEVATPAAVAQLQRLSQRVSQPSARATIDAAIRAAAARLGLTRADLEELTTPTFGLQDGRVRVELGEYNAEIAVTGTTGVELRWLAADGSLRRSEPAAIKREHAQARTELKRTVTELRRTLPVQRDRIERLYFDDREWPLATWRERYLDHPLLSLLTRRLIWQLQDGGRHTTAAWLDGTPAGSDDQPLTGLSDETRVRLWHPINADAETVGAWQTWLERHQVTQPFKQAHREVYRVTDAERRTSTYSNRFAAHILRQHQLKALCDARGWRYSLQGAFDGSSEPTLDLPQWNLQVHFGVEPIGNAAVELSPAGIALYVATEQVVFRRTLPWEPVPITEIPPRILSEIMRDVDLFVGVCSVGNDPTWFDGRWHGAEMLRDYWESYAFGDLSASAQTRHTLLTRLLPRLAIADRCTLSDRYLVVRGDLRTYKIHLGSANIQMEPNNQYLCIVPDNRRGATAGNVLLPFDGDATLSIILSKAFLLANDTAITDPTINRQIRTH